MSSGALVLGLLNGLLIGLLGVGLVIVYKANRFLNLAHGQLGAVSAMLLGKFVLDWGWPWWVAFAVAVPVGALTGVAVDRFLIRPLRRHTASKVSLLLMSVGATQVLLALVFVPALRPDPSRLNVRGYPVPFTAHVQVGGVVLTGAHLLIAVLGPVLVGALAAFLRWTTLGKSIRAAASNPDEARLCGVSITRVSAVSWALAGGISAVTAILQAPSQAAFDAASLGPDLLLVALGAAAVGAFTSIPGALAGGLLLGLAQQLTLAATSSGGDALLVVVAVILVTILVRGRAIGRVFEVTGSAVEDRRPPVVPAAVRDRAVVRRQPLWSAALALAVAVLLPLLPFFRTEAHRFQLVLVLVYALVGLGLTLLVGWAGQVSLGHFAVVGIGAFLMARLDAHHLSLPVLLAVAGAVGAGALVVVGLPALRVRGLTLAVTSLGLAVIGPEWLFHQSWFGSTQGLGVDVSPPMLARGLGTPRSQLALYFVSLALLTVAVAAAGALRRSGPGRVVLAVRDNERAAAAFGVTPATVKLAVLALSGFLSGAAGVLWADAWRTTNAGQFDPVLSVAILAVPVVGGLGSVTGAVAGAAVIYLPAFFLSPALSGLFGDFGHQVGFQLLLSGLGLIVVLRSYPAGVAGLAGRAWQAFLDRLAADWTRRLPAAEPPPLEVDDLALSFGGVHALRGAAIRVGPGEIVGLIGPNGAGKTTLLNVVSGTLAPDRGSVKVFGTDMSGLPPEFRRAVGMTRSFQDARLFPGLTVRETIQVALGATRKTGMLGAAAAAPWARAAERASRGQADDIIARLGLEEWADIYVSDLSTGTRRVCDLAAQLAAAPGLLLLDEPTAGLAQREVEAFGPLLHRVRDELGCAVLIVEHDMALLMGLCDRIYALEAGAVLAEGTPEQIRNDPVVIASYLGADPAAVERSGRGSAGAAVSAVPAGAGAGTGRRSARPRP